MIVHTGEALIDFIPVVDSDGSAAYRPSPGGSPYNSAIAAARLGAHVAFLGKLSTDFFGDQLFDRLATNGVDTGLVVRSPRPSTLAFVKKTETGDARYAFFADGAADRDLQPVDLPMDRDDIDAIAFGSISLIADPVSATILDLVERESKNRVISFDPNVRTVLVNDPADYRSRVARAIGASTILKISDEEVAWYLGDDDLEAGARRLLAEGPSLVVVTAGPDGAIAACGSVLSRVPAEPTSVSDTIGAGDSFHAALLVWLSRNGLLSQAAVTGLQERQLASMLRFAAAVAAKTCSRPGADPPQLSELHPALLETD